MKYTPQLMNLDALYRTRRNPHASRWNVDWSPVVPAAMAETGAQSPDNQLTRVGRQPLDPDDEA